MCTSTNLITFDIQKVYPIKDYPGYVKNLDYSDKIVLPLQICHALVRNAVHFPPIFLVQSKSNKKISFLCGVLEYTSEIDTLYCPHNFAKKLRPQSLKNYKNLDQSISLLNRNQGVTLEVVLKSRNKFPFPELTRVEILPEVTISESSCRRGLLAYSILRKGNSLTVMIT